MDNVEVLTNARNRVAYNWIQGRATDGIDGFCAVGAIHQDYDCDPSSKLTPCAALAKAIGLPNVFSLPKWNDAPERTQLEVIAAFDKAIALAEGRIEPIAPHAEGRRE